MKLVQVSYAFELLVETLEYSPFFVSNKFLKDLSIRPWASKLCWRFSTSTSASPMSSPQDCKSKNFKFKTSMFLRNCKSSPSTLANSLLQSLIWFEILWSSIVTSFLVFERDDKRSFSASTSFFKTLLYSYHSMMHIANCNSCAWWLWLHGWAMAFVWVFSLSSLSRSTPS